MRIFMAGQKEWCEPGGIAMVILAKMMVVGALLSLAWVSYGRFFTHGAAARVAGHKNR